MQSTTHDESVLSLRWCSTRVLVLAEWSVWGAIVLISVAGRGGWAKRAGLGRRSHLELKRGLHLELNGVRLLFVERRWQGDDEW